MTPDLDRRFWQAHDYLRLHARIESLRLRLRHDGLSETEIATVLEQRPDAEYLRNNYREFIASLPSNGSGEVARMAATVMVEAAEALQDRQAWMFVMAAFDEFVSGDLQPPMPILKALNGILHGVRSGRSFEEVIQRERGRGRRSAGLSGRDWARTNASLVHHWHDDMGDSLEVACEKVAELRSSMDAKSGKRRSKGDQHGISESKIKADYLAWKRGEI